MEMKWNSVAAPVGYSVLFYLYVNENVPWSSNYFASAQDARKVVQMSELHEVLWEYTLYVQVIGWMVKFWYLEFFAAQYLNGPMIFHMFLSIVKSFWK